MKNRRLNPWGSLLILAGIIVPVAAFFVALWQEHPDPSAFQPGEIGGLNLVVFEGSRVFECEDTGEILPMSEHPENLGEDEFLQFYEANVFVKGRVETGIVNVIVGGMTLAAAGVVICFRRKG